MGAENLYVGIDLGGTDIKGGLLTKEGKIIIQNKIPTEVQGGVEDVLNRIARLVKDLMQSAAEGGKVTGVGIGMPGQVNVKEGIYREGPNLPGFIDVPVASEIGKRLNLPAKMDNDANVAALGEAVFGAGGGVRDMMMVTLGTGVGSGLIINGEIYHGTNGTAGEFGHTKIQVGGPLCACGKNGCIEAFIGIKGILQRLQEKLDAGQESVLSNVDFQDMNPKMISDAADKGDKTALEVLNDTGKYLGLALSNVVNLLNVERIVVGGGVANAGESIMKPARESMYNNALKVTGEVVELMPASLGESAGLIGAARLVM
jgi:glucokinase